MSEEIRKMIAEVNRKFGEAVRNQDPVALASLYTEDACFLPPNSEMVRGRQRIQETLAGMMQMGVKDVTLTTVELLGSGDSVQEIGTYKQKIQPEGQDAIEDLGKYLVVWKKTPEGWKLHWDILNTSLPPPE